MLIVGASLVGYDIKSTDGKVGTVSDILFDDHSWKIRWVVVDTGNWLPGRKVLVHPSAIGFPDHANKHLPVELTKARIVSGPDLAMDAPVSRRMESSMNGYYGWDPLWGGGYLSGGAMAMPVHLEGGVATRENEDDGDPRLRSMAAVNGYHIHAKDGDLGHLENFLLDEASWTVRYLILNTSNWWSGKQVLLSPYAVTEVSWTRAELTVNVTREQIKSSPPWHPLEIIEQAYQEGLHRHYGWPRHGW